MAVAKRIAAGILVLAATDSISGCSGGRFYRAMRTDLYTEDHWVRNRKISQAWERYYIE